MKRRSFKGVVITPVRNVMGNIIEAPSIYVGLDEAPSGSNQYEKALKVAKEKSGLSRFESWEFV